MSLVKAIKFNTHAFEIDNDGNRQLIEKEWLVPNTDYVYYAIASKRFVGEINFDKVFDFQFKREARVPVWLPNVMAEMMIEDEKGDYIDLYETEMTNGYGTINAFDEMVGDY